MKVKMLSRFSNKVNEMDLDVTQEQLDAWRGSKTLVQNAFPHLNADEREFLMTGVTPEEWDKFMGPER